MENLKINKKSFEITLFGTAIEYWKDLGMTDQDIKEFGTDLTNSATELIVKKLAKRHNF